MCLQYIIFDRFQIPCFLNRFAEQAIRTEKPTHTYIHSVFFIRDIVIFGLGPIPYFSKILHRNVPHFVSYFSGKVASLCLKFPQTQLSTLCLSLLATNLPSVPYLGQSLLSLVVLRGLGPVPYFSKKYAQCPLQPLPYKTYKVYLPVGGSWSSEQMQTEMGIN